MRGLQACSRVRETGAMNGWGTGAEPDGSICPSLHPPLLLRSSCQQCVDVTDAKAPGRPAAQDTKPGRHYGRESADE